tara:strand:+ start:964 stop:1569 length:606 start_codon:yes stop_codon:yes gene_type:complete
MGNNYKFILSALATVLSLFVVANVEANPIRQYIEIDRADLKLLIGEKIYNQPGDGCWSCHGAEGMKVDSTNLDTSKKNKNIADLRDPTTWTSYKIITKYSGESEMLSQRDISLSLVRLGAEDWNQELAPAIKKYTGSNVIFFDEQMIGIHSKLLKKNTRSMSRNLKREKVKFKGKDIMDIMATSVFFYIENKFIGKKSEEK